MTREIPPSPYPISSETNCKTAGWKDFFCGLKRDECPFPLNRPDLHKGWVEGWDAAQATKVTAPSPPATSSAVEALRVTDAMVEAAMAVAPIAHRGPHVFGPERMRAALEAALQVGTEVEVKADIAVKPLEWKQHKENWRYKGGIEKSWEAEAITGRYIITFREHDPVTVNLARCLPGPFFEPYFMVDCTGCGRVERTGEVKSLEEAKAVCEADYESRIRSALAPVQQAGVESGPLKMPTDPEWYMRKAKLEEGHEVGVGRLTSTINLTPEEIAEYERLALEALPEWARKEIEASRAAKAGVESELVERLRATANSIDDLADDGHFPAHFLEQARNYSDEAREAAASLSQLHQRIAEVERERDEARANHEYFATQWDDRGYALKAAEAALAASDAKLAEKDREIKRLLNSNIGSSM